MIRNRLVGGLITLGLLTSNLCAHAQTSFSEQHSFQVITDTVSQSFSADTIPVINLLEKEKSEFSPRQLILPGALISVGVIGVYCGGFKKLNQNIKNGMENLRGTHYLHADDYIQYLPALTYLTFGSIGIKAKHSFKERLAVGATAYLAMAALTNIGKYSFREKRPDSNARNSFPSGHTATVFTGAELMREEYGLGIGIGAYTIATGVAFLRLYNGRHWLNDVIAGAGLGILSARIGYWMLPLYQKWFNWNRHNTEMMVLLPAYDHTERSFSINLSYTF